MKIIQLTANNILNLTAVSITPDRNLVTITGPNGSGKSAILNSVWMALGGSDAMPQEPIRRGAKEATIKLNLGNGAPELEIIRRITSSGTTLTVKDAKGNVQRSPQAILDSLIGKGFIDPLALSRVAAGQQIQTLRGLTGLDFTKEEQEKAKLFQERTLVNRELDAAKKRLAAVPFDKEAPAEPVQIADLTAQLAEAERTNRANAQQRVEADKSEEWIQARKDKAEAIGHEIAELQRTIEARQKELAILNEGTAQREEYAKTKRAEINGLVDIDTSDIRSRIDGAETVNRKVAANRQHAALSAEVAAKKKESDKLTAQIEAIDTAKANKIREAKFPLEGLTVDDAGILFHGLPLAQASTAEQLKVWTAVAMALKPRLKVLFIRDGSLLDESSLKAVAEMAETNDYQVLMEDARSKDPSAIVIEDGHVKNTTETTEKELTLS